ncbi:MAG: elongation factor P [Spirochaetes bacterium]|nr:elongation factor P [Spirochaetota bacterium]
MAVGTNDVRKGETLLIDNVLYLVLETGLHRQQQRKAQVRMKLKNLKTGNVLEKSYSSTDSVELAEISFKKAQYLYKDTQGYIFMILDNYDQLPVPETIVGDAKDYLLENMEADLQFYDDEVIAVRLPVHVVLAVTYTEPGFKGDTQSGGTKPATLETGLRVNVPLFIQIGEKLRIDTRTNTYVERVKE